MTYAIGLGWGAVSDSLRSLVPSGEPLLAAGASKTWLVVIAAIAVGVGMFLLLVVLFGGGTNRRDSNISGRLGAYGDGDGKAGGLFGRFRILRRAASKAESVAQSDGNALMIEAALDQANIPLSAGEAIVGAIGIAGITGLVMGLVTRSVIWGVVLAAAVLIISFLYVNRVAAKARKRFDNQLPDTLNLLATSLRAGYSIMQAIEAVAKEAPEPTRREFGRAMSEIRLGRPMIDSLGDIAVRMESQDFEWTVMAISIQREVGGNLAEVLQSTSETMMQRNRLRREMKALTAEGRISAIIMGALPFVLFGVLWVINPNYLKPLYTTTMGWVLIGGSLILMLIGIYSMQKIVKVDV